MGWSVSAERGRPFLHEHTQAYSSTHREVHVQTQSHLTPLSFSHTHIRQICSVHQHILAADIHISISCLSSSSVFYFSPHILHLWYIFAKQRSWRLSTLQKVLFIHVTRHYSVSQQSNPSISIKPCSLNPSAYPSLITKKHMSFFTMNPAAKM